ncbi:hypothetical protein B0I35DRAFT_139790 [Stachybotrys elegans]|uniref:Uncharacterized protein n=1 Tax=Stachybotrys elegans TaxID=80388 RepID=A0A8K0WVW0_9HYPO|nr:hypothetical protein B0I35DRAFT_139790 [Stachybotrys elegans]
MTWLQQSSKPYWGPCGEYGNVPSMTHATWYHGGRGRGWEVCACCCQGQIYHLPSPRPHPPCTYGLWDRSLRLSSLRTEKSQTSISQPCVGCEHRSIWRPDVTPVGVGGGYVTASTKPIASRLADGREKKKIRRDRKRMNGKLSVNLKQYLWVTTCGLATFYRPFGLEPLSERGFHVQKHSYVILCGGCAFAAVPRRTTELVPYGVDWVYFLAH